MGSTHTQYVRPFSIIDPARKHSHKNRSFTWFTYQKLNAPSAPRDATFEHVRMDKDEAIWRFYRHRGDERDLPTRPSHVILVACQQAQLFRIIHESLSLYCPPSEKVTAGKFLAIYARYLDWMLLVPPVVRDIEENDQPLPHVLYLQYETLCAGRVFELLTSFVASNTTLLWCSTSALFCILAFSMRMTKKSCGASLYFTLGVASRFLNIHDVSIRLVSRCPC